GFYRTGCISRDIYPVLNTAFFFNMCLLDISRTDIIDYNRSVRPESLPVCAIFKSLDFYSGVPVPMRGKCKRTFNVYRLTYYTRSGSISLRYADKSFMGKFK
ncbi:unnamed protein product, partial [marine sediment metagenome]